jgi:L-iditol 2-dehydrogenase
MMKAWVLYGINDLRLIEVPTPTPKNGEVLVQVKAAGICSSDIPRVYTTGAYHYPIILGHEFSGITSDGRRVGVFPLIPCHHCESCQTGHYETCSNYSYIGSRQDGAFAEYVAVPEWNLITLPDNMTFEQAALLEPAAVALHAVKQISIQMINRVVIIGNGTIGLLIGEWLKQYGIETVDVLGRDHKDFSSNYDVCIEAVGTSDAFRRCIELVRQNGEVILVGNPNVDFKIDQKLYWQILRKQLTLHGSWNSSYPSDWQEVLENAVELHLDSFISHKDDFSRLNAAFDMIYNKRERHRKIIVTLG